MAKIWDEELPPNVVNRLEIFTSFGNEMRRHGIANFIYSDSDYTFVHSHKRLIKFGTKETSPGLHILRDLCTRVWREKK